MTKMKSKKMTKSTFAIIIMGIVMVAMLAFGGTFAYFTAKSNSQSASLTTGVIKLSSGTSTNATITAAVYGTPVLGAVTFDASGTTADSYVFVKLTSTTNGATWAQLFGDELTVEDGWTAYAAGSTENVKVYYATVTANNGTNMPFLKELKITASPKYVEGSAQPVEMGATASIKVEAEAIQKDYLVGEDEAAKLATAYAALFQA